MEMKFPHVSSHTDTGAIIWETKVIDIEWINDSRVTKECISGHFFSIVKMPEHKMFFVLEREKNLQEVALLLSC